MIVYLLGALLALSPVYVVRFGTGGRTVNLLQILILAFWICFVWYCHKNKIWSDFFNFIKSKSKFLLISVCLFALAGVISVFISPDKTRATGLFFSYFLQPIITFFPAAYILKEQKNKEIFLGFALVAIAVFSLYGIIQYFTYAGLPQQWWGNLNEPKRIISIFEYPNAFALWLAPLLAFLLPFIFVRKKIIAYSLIPGLIAVALTMSRGAWLGLIVAAVAYIFLAESIRAKKIVTAAIIALLIIIAAIPNLRYRIILPFYGEKSAVSRFSLWRTANKMLEDSPLLGKGLYGYKTNFDKYNVDPNLTSINYPHNIFLNFLVETGVLGLLSFLALCGYKVYQYLMDRKNLFKFGALLFLITTIIHGLVDAPYFKNDLSLIFWLILAI